METVRLYNKHEDYESKKKQEVYVNKYCLSHCMDKKDCHVYDRTVVTMDWLAENTNGGITKQIDEGKNIVTYTFKENLIDELDVFKEYTISDFNSKYLNNDDSSNKYIFSFKTKSISQDFANHIVNLINNNKIKSGGLYSFNIEEFSGELNMKIQIIEPFSGIYYLSLDNMFNGSGFTKITISSEKNVVLGSLVDAFKGARKLQEVKFISDGQEYAVPQNSNAGVSGAFEFCSNLKKLPKLYYKYFSNCQYAFELCGIEELPIFDENDDTIYLKGSATQMFNSCNWIKKIHPILDLGITDDIEEHNFKLFIMAEGLTSVKIKGITRFSIDFVSGKEGFLIPQMDAESALYAINNALDVTELGGLSMNFPAKTNQNGELNAVVNSAKAKGWTIKVDGQEIQQS